MEIDYAGLGQAGVRLERFYNSLGGEPAAQFGKNWRHNYARSILTFSTNTGLVSVVRPDGKSFIFKFNNGAWIGDADVTATLTELKDATGTRTGWRYTTPEDETESYGATGKLLFIANRQSLTQTLTYDANDRLTTVTNPFGRKLAYTYDTNNRISTLTDPAGGVYTYAYDINNNLNSVTYPDGKVRTYLYENTSYPNALTGITDENGQRFASYWYDAQGRAVKEEHAPSLNQGIDQYQLTFNTDSSGNPTNTVVTDPLGTARTYNYQVILGVAKSTGTNQPGGAGCGPASSAVTYDANGNIASRTDFNGVTTTYTYDLTRNLELSRTEAAGTPQARTITTAWHPAYRLPVRVAEPGRATDYSYDAQGNLLAKTVTDTASGASRSWRHTYNQYGQVLSVDGPRTDVADVTTYTYDAQGNLASVTNPLGQTTRYTAYDPNGRPLSVVNPNGVVTTLAYDPRGRLTSRNVGGETTAYAYDGVGQITQVTLPDGSLVAYTYDAAHRLTNVADGAGNHVAYTLDGLGKRISEDTYDPAGALTKSLSRAYDALGRLQTLTGVGAE